MKYCFIKTGKDSCYSIFLNLESEQDVLHYLQLYFTNQISELVDYRDDNGAHQIVKNSINDLTFHLLYNLNKGMARTLLEINSRIASCLLNLDNMGYHMYMEMKYILGGTIH